MFGRVPRRPFRPLQPSWGPLGIVGGGVGDVSDYMRTGLDNLRLSGAVCGRVEASGGLPGGLFGDLKGGLGFLCQRCPEGKVAKETTVRLGGELSTRPCESGGELSTFPCEPSRGWLERITWVPVLSVCRCDAVSRRLQPSWGSVGAVLEPSWALQGACWRPLEGSLGLLGAPWGRLGAY